MSPSPVITAIPRAICALPMIISPLAMPAMTAPLAGVWESVGDKVKDNVSDRLGYTVWHSLCIPCAFAGPFLHAQSPIPVTTEA